MKYKTTRKAIVAGTPTNNLVCVGYCDLSNLLWGHEPIAYTSGVYGWNFGRAYRTEDNLKYLEALDKVKPFWNDRLEW